MARRIHRVSSTGTRRLHSGLLDALVERIARSTNSSAVFVSAESPETGVGLVAEFPVAAASIQLDRYPSEGGADSRWPDGQVVTTPVRLGEEVIGWAAAVGPSLDHDKEAEELVTLLARCATVLLGRQSAGRCAEQRPRWEDVARDGYWEWDFEPGVMRFSRRSLALLDHQSVDRPTRPDVWLDRIHPDDRAGVYSALLTAAIAPDPVDHEHRVVRRDGSIRSVIMRASADQDDTGRPIRLVGWLCDVSRLRRVEADLKNAQLLADVGRVAAGAAHDFNNFLTVIRGNTELALGFVAPDSLVAENLELIKHAAAGATALTKQLLNVRRRQTPVQTIIDLNEAVTGAERTLRSLVGNRANLVLELRSGLGLVRADAAQTHRLLINLVVNALDAMPEGGTLTVATDSTTQKTLGSPAKPLLLPRGDYVTLSVRDTGAGMDEATRLHIFEPFFSTKPSGQGTGLGLWIVRDIMERSGGAIDVRSTPGSGAEFVMYFPAAENPVV
jgi:signal transduction histidine kinase